MATSDKSFLDPRDRFLLIEALKVRRAQVQRSANNEPDLAVVELRKALLSDLDALAYKLTGQGSISL